MLDENRVSRHDIETQAIRATQRLQLNFSNISYKKMKLLPGLIDDISCSSCLFCSFTANKLRYSYGPN